MKQTIGIGVAGGIACYKIVELVSRLKKLDYEVIIMMTESATKFVTPLTFKTMSGREVILDLWNDSQEWKVQHIGVAESLDLMVIAPATANMIGKMANGIADDLLSTVCLACTSPVMVVPSMNSNMFLHPSVQDNMRLLEQRGVEIISPASGRLACGVEGPGRLPEVDDILAAILTKINRKQDLIGKKFLINAGSTREDIDPVRFIGNRSTGKMGYALAKASVERGAEVVLISGPTALVPPPEVEFVSTWSGEEMYQAMQGRQMQADVIIGSAAVGDFKIAERQQQKIKKTGQTEKFVLELVETTDILKELGSTKPAGQIMVGFAAETNDVVNYARNKLTAKNLDLIVANDVTEEGAGFGTETNIVTMVYRDGHIEELPKMTKEAVAHALLDRIMNLF